MKIHLYYIFVNPAGTSCWNPPLCKISCLFCMVNTMAADDLATQGAGTSAAISAWILSFSNKLPFMEEFLKDNLKTYQITVWWLAILSLNWNTLRLFSRIIKKKKHLQFETASFYQFLTPLWHRYFKSFLMEGKNLFIIPTVNTLV